MKEFYDMSREEYGNLIIHMHTISLCRMKPHKVEVAKAVHDGRGVSRFIYDEYPELNEIH